MSKHRHDLGTSHPHGGLTGRRRFPMGLIGLVLGTVIAAAIFILAPHFSRFPAAPPVRSSETPTSNAPATDESGKVNPQRLLGKWLRQDGDYTLDIQNVKGDGKLEVAYLNPKPIHVSRAEMEEDGKKLRVLVELRDTGYPGCTYKLTYDPVKDQLAGAYFQAALNETFEVVFARMK